MRDRSSVPHRQPTKTDPEVIEKVLWLCQQYHFGPHKISMYLARYHDINVSPSGVWRILQARSGPVAGLATIQTHSDVVEAIREATPGHRLQVDVKFVEPHGQTGKKRRYY